jgi:multidrug efflux pump
MFQKIGEIKKLTDVSTDQQDAGSRLMVKVDRNTASRLGILSQQIDDTLYDAFGQRQVATIFTQLDQYHVILEVDPRVQQSPDALSKIYVKSASGAQVPLSAFASFERTTAPLVVSHQGQFPALTISFNLAPGVALSEAIDLVKEAEREAHLPPSVIPSFQGTAQAFQASLVSMPWLIAAAIVAVYIVLGILYESYLHPLTILSTIPSAGVGALLMLRGFGYPLDMIGLIGIILLIGIVKKNAIMMIDFALEAERNHGMAPQDSIYQAALTADHDDHDGRLVQRHSVDGDAGCRRGAAPASGLRHRRRAGPVADADPVHHAGGVPDAQPLRDRGQAEPVAEADDGGKSEPGGITI